ncbi:caspase recruitment domain-containing protein 8-like [Meles meles]|uniref:caspase recruitment domain-containing protein 8-like n=1 Tax=Meles meles TaxID=9662 RepID=UPI001E69F1A5|nr:caspase recruitment domain-containing protein 8-like [Meles meles]XP_045843769.1 caspase recruitment domain-containing protein 8-like [Meles meles]XP_045843770.1 caspase recruitment domain-containing protein 8-like [Meles meles]XP_045843771.1 caspase recruitment domain-containing protein 8-like [Meles meles]
MSSGRSRRCCLTWRRLCGCCWFGSTDPSRQSQMLHHAPQDSRPILYQSENCARTLRIVEKVTDLRPPTSSGYEVITEGPTPYVPAAGLPSYERALSNEYYGESLYSCYETWDEGLQLCPSSDYEDMITTGPTAHIPADEPVYWEEAVSKAPGSSGSEDQESAQILGSEETWLEEKTLVPLEAPKLFFGVGPACHSYQFLGPEGNVDIELIDESASKYSVHFPMAGFYMWPATRLGFLVTAAVTVRIAFDSWSQHPELKLQHEEQWMVAGPLFDISVEPEGVIAEIHLPHIISLPANEVDMSWFHVAHFKDEGMVLETPARVEPFYAVLENPSFSLMGMLLKLASAIGIPVPITSTALLYYHFYPEDIKFHLYLIPSDALLMKAIDDEETKFHGVRLQTSPPVKPLYFASSYILSDLARLEIMPKELKLSYRSPGEPQAFSKVFAGKMEEPITFEVTEQTRKTLVWHTLVKPVELLHCAAASPTPLSVETFMKENHRHLRARLGELNGVLDDLQDSEVFTEEEKELVQQFPTQQRKNETLLRMVEKKGPQALEILYRSLQQRDPYLMSYLSQQSL